MLHAISPLSWMFAIDGAVLTALGLWKAIEFARSPGITGTIHRSVQRAAYALSYTLMMALIVVVAIWDQAHQGHQFPYVLRLTLTIPALLLGNYALIVGMMFPEHPKKKGAGD